MKLSSLFKKKPKDSFEDRLAQLHKTLEKNPKDLRIHTKIAELYLEHGQKEKAIEAYHAAAKEYRKTGKTSIVTAVYNHILSLDPGQVDVYSRMCDIYLEDHLVGDAVEVLVRLADYYYKQDMHYEASQALKSIKDIDPDNTFYKAKVEKFYKAHNLNEEQIQKMGPKDKWSLVDKEHKKESVQIPPSGGFFDLEDFLDGSSSINIHSQSGEGLPGSSSPSQNHVEPDKVLDKLESLMDAQTEESSPEFHYNFALVQVRQGDYAKAIEHFSKALVGIQNKQGCYFLLIDCCIKAEQFDAAAKHINQAVKLKTLTPKERLWLDFQTGLVYKSRGDNKKALKLFKKIHAADKSFKGVAKLINELT